MKYLMEHEVAFDATQIGFPSISGCHAIVYQTEVGLYGFHVAGCSDDDRWKPMATMFSQFVNGHGGFAQKGTRLYGASFVGNNGRGYKVNAFVAEEYKRKWREELVAYATALHYSGKISGYDLHSGLSDSPSAYVKYMANGKKCDMHIRQWDHGEMGTRAGNLTPLDHMVKSGGSLENQGLVNQPRTVGMVNAAALTHVHKEKLR